LVGRAAKAFLKSSFGMCVSDWATCLEGGVSRSVELVTSDLCGRMGVLICWGVVFVFYGLCDYQCLGLGLGVVWVHVDVLWCVRDSCDCWCLSGASSHFV
jgi:hypothetical protein